MIHERKSIIQQLLDPLIRYWQIVVATIFLIIAFADMRTADTLAARRLDSIETKVVTLEQNQPQIMVQLSQIQTDLAWIKTRLKNDY